MIKIGLLGVLGVGNFPAVWAVVTDGPTPITVSWLSGGAVLTLAGLLWRKVQKTEAERDALLAKLDARNEADRKELIPTLTRTTTALDRNTTTLDRVGKLVEDLPAMLRDTLQRREGH
jgi:hypothetical protein